MGEQRRRKDAALVDKGRSGSRGRVKSAGLGRIGKIRITGRGILLFMAAMVLLDILFYALFRFGFNSCYAVLCLFD